MVYGSDIGTANSLRLFKKGLLLVDPFVRPEELPVLPAAESAGGEAGFCRSFDTTIVPCFRAGDPRVNENHGGRNQLRRNFKIVLLRNPKLSKSFKSQRGRSDNIHNQ